MKGTTEMNDKKLRALYGLKYNPFLPDIPVEALWVTPQMDSFVFRLENLVKTGGFALICAEPGLGKSKTLQLLNHRLESIGDVKVGVMQRPQSSVADFYREMGDLFGVNLSPANRYGGFKALRQRWRDHVKNTLYKPLLLIDEAQEVLSVCLNEIRLLQSDYFDSKSLLTSVLCGDMRLPQRFRTPQLASLGTRMRLRLNISPYPPKTLLEFLEHNLKHAGAEHLMTKDLKQTLADHAAGNLRVLNTMASDLLAAAAEKQLPQLNEQLYFEVFSPKRTTSKKRSN
jgi:type II secretory pathway predicted ATPase ExeA